jgi:formate hydrogenlyase subunit 3/multisubunit Na+/H+ antiporter MnhD subunit
MGGISMKLTCILKKAGVFSLIFIAGMLVMGATLFISMFTSKWIIQTMTGTTENLTAIMGLTLVFMITIMSFGLSIFYCYMRERENKQKIIKLDPNTVIGNK